MIPIRDVSQRVRGNPSMTWLLIAANVGVFVLQLSGGDLEMQVRTLRFAAVPANIVGRDPVVWALAEVRRRTPHGLFSGVDIVAVPSRYSPEEREAHVIQQLRRQGFRVEDHEIIEPAIPAWLTLITSMFMHGGWGHILGNMIFLFVFGARLEDRLGVPRYLLFYLVTGAAAALTHVAFDPSSAVPMVGASGAISGLLGGYVLLWPHGRILTLIPIGWFMTFYELPALIFIGVWVLMQLFLIHPTGAQGGIAVWAHLGGFVYGLALVKLFDPQRGRARPRGPDDGPSQLRRPDGWYDERHPGWPV